MTISVPEQLVFAYNGDGSTTVFSYPVRFLDQDEIVVISRVAGVDTVKVLDTDYTVAGAGDANGGSVTTLYVPAVGETIILRRATEAKQIVNLADGQRTPAEAVEQQFDRLAMVAQDHDQRIDDIEDKTADIDQAVKDAQDSAAAAATSEGNASDSADAAASSATNASDSAAAAAASAASIDPASIVHKADDDASTFGFVLDEDDMASDSDEKLPTQQSVKAYNNNRFVASRVALAALAAGLYASVLMNEPSREGWFKWNSADLSTEVAADTRQGLYVAPSSDATGASGAWVRQGGWALTGADINWFYETADAGDYSAAINAAAAVTGLLTVSPGGYQIVSGVTWPAKNIVFNGPGFTQARFYGNASALFAWPSSVTDGSGNVVTQNMRNVTVEQTGDGIGLQIHQTWDAAGKIGPQVNNCRLFNSSATTTTAKCISLQGIWVADICNNWFLGKGSGGAPTTGIGGYGVYTDLGTDLSTAVMNVGIKQNNFLKLAYPVWISDRAISTGGRVEGLSVFGNWMVAGNIAIRMSATLGSIIVGNLISDFSDGIQSNADFDFAITGNPLIDGAVASVHLKAVSGGILERGTISGNTIKAKGSTIGIKIENTVANGAIRVLSIGNNTIGSVQSGSATATGIQFTGSFTATNITISANAFEYLAYGIDYNGATNSDIHTSGNAYSGVTTKINNPSRSGVLIDKIYKQRKGVALAGGATSETYDLDISSAGFASAPASASSQLDGSYLTTGNRVFVIGYDPTNAASTASSARFVIARTDGASLSAQTLPFLITCFGQGYATE